MTADGLLVRKPGPQCLLQDLGRRGHFRQGITVGGPADRLGFLWANRLCGNRANTTALEVLLGGALLEATAPCQVALAGGEVTPLINGAPVANWASHNLHAGDRLEIPPLRDGLRIYVAVRGGFQVCGTLGSTATVVREGLGGLHGEPLAAGDLLPVLASRDEPRFYLPVERRPLPRDRVLALVPGWQYRDFSRDFRKAFFTATFRVTNASDRMGVRLAAPRDIALPGAAGDMVSEGVIAGALQVPPDGQPIVMMVDHQTMGGYPKLGTLASVDLWRLAQLRPGSEFRFRPVSSARARAVHRRAIRQFEGTEPLPA